MNKLIKSSLYKLLRDWTFRITLIVGVGLAVIMCLIYLGIDVLNSKIGQTCNGYAMYISSLSPTQNFGLTVPINLIVFTIGEFNCGTIRNKIVAGNRKSLIYISLILTGLIFTITLMLIYFALSVGISSLIGGFKGLNNNIDTVLLYQYPLMGICTYIFIVTFAIFIASSIRTIGGTMPIVIITIVLLYFASMIPNIGSSNELLKNIEYWVNPLNGFGCLGLSSLGLYSHFSTTQFISVLVTPLYWAVIFALLGIVVFNRKDVK